MTQTPDNGGPAFPSEQTETQDGCWNQTYEAGMTLREYAALQALPAIIAACAHDTRNNGETHAEMFARKSL